MEYNKLTNENKDLRMSNGKESTNSRNRQGTNTMEPDENRQPDFDISGDKKNNTIPVDKGGSKSDIGD